MKSQFRFLIGGEVMEELVVKSIATIGIPGAIAFFLLIKFSRSIDGLTDAINKLVAENQKIYMNIEQHFFRLEEQLKKDRERE